MWVRCLRVPGSAWRLNTTPQLSSGVFFEAEVMAEDFKETEYEERRKIRDRNGNSSPFNTNLEIYRFLSLTAGRMCIFSSFFFFLNDTLWFILYMFFFFLLLNDTLWCILYIYIYIYIYIFFFYLSLICVVLYFHIMM